MDLVVKGIIDLAVFHCHKSMLGTIINEMWTRSS
jgi:hypothetical protein